ncbi:MAG TPA: amidase domain-containing protein [Firmicutes bacterium]|nr:amidase domain-containing protein [Bacillota bacterium]
MATGTYYYVGGECYYVDNAVKYSDTYALNYNTLYTDFGNSDGSGGDCANFASQCIDYGAGYTLRNNTWKPYTSAWTSSTSSVNYWAGIGTRINAPSASQIKKACPVYYDWDGIYNYNTFLHTAFCVGKDSSGVPIVNCHTVDYKHIRWNYGGSACKYATVQLY